MGLKSSILLHEEDIEELHNETGCKLKEFCWQMANAYCSPLGCTLFKSFFTTSYHLNECLIVVSLVSPNQIRRLYSRFKSLDKATKGTIRLVKCVDLEPFVFAHRDEKGLSWCTGTRGNSYCFHNHTCSYDAVR